MEEKLNKLLEEVKLNKMICIVNENKEYYQKWLAIENNIKKVIKTKC